MVSWLGILCAAAVLTAAPTDNKPEAAPLATVLEHQKIGVAQYLQDISLTIKSASGEGSGVIRTIRGVSYVWTAAHVVASLRSVDELIDPLTGTKRQHVKFNDGEVVKEETEDGRKVGETKRLAEVIRYSDSEDLALLRVRKKSFSSANVRFYIEPSIPPIGTDLYHVGSLMGQMGSNSMTSGIISQIGRVLPDNPKVEYDQTNCTSFPGSSGGGIYLRDGRYVGMLVRGAGEGFSIFIPVRRMAKWAKSAGVYWAMDDAAKVPTEDEMKKLPIEDTGVKFGSGAGPGTQKDFPYLFKWANSLPAGPRVPTVLVPRPVEP